jgi:hypothetical protein
VDGQANNRGLVTWLTIALIATGMVAALADERRQSGSPTRTADASLIELGLTTKQSKTASGSGGFKATVLAKSGLVSALYDCRSAVEKTAREWAQTQAVRLAERKEEPQRLNLTYSSIVPPGFFVLDYRLSPSRMAVEDIRLSFLFRTLANVELPGDEVGLKALGFELFKAAQCVPE